MSRSSDSGLGLILLGGALLLAFSGSEDKVRGRANQRTERRTARPPTTTSSTSDLADFRRGVDNRRTEDAAVDEPTTTSSTSDLADFRRGVDNRRTEDAAVDDDGDITFIDYIWPGA